MSIPWRTTMIRKRRSRNSTPQSPSPRVKRAPRTQCKQGDANELPPTKIPASCPWTRAPAPATHCAGTTAPRWQSAARSSTAAVRGTETDSAPKRTASCSVGTPPETPWRSEEGGESDCRLRGDRRPVKFTSRTLQEQADSPFSPPSAGITPSFQRRTNSPSSPNPGTKYSQTCHSKDDHNPYLTLRRKYSLLDIPQKLRICKCIQPSENEPGQLHSHSLTVVGVRIPVFNFFKMAQLKYPWSTEMLKSHIIQME